MLFATNADCPKLIWCGAGQRRFSDADHRYFGNALLLLLLLDQAE
jgi:hypothetical protein